MSEDFISWEITKMEKRERAHRLLLAIGVPFILTSAIGVLLYRPFSFLRLYFTGRLNDFFYQALIIIIVSIGAILTLLLLNRVLPYANRKYYLDNNGVTVWKGKRKKHFAWNELESFSVHKSMYFFASTKEWPGEEMRKEIEIASERIEGTVFYLSKKPKNRFLGMLSKTFVVLYSEPDTAQRVSYFLSRHLPEKVMGPTADLGLRFYYFR